MKRNTTFLLALVLAAAMLLCACTGNPASTNNTPGTTTAGGNPPIIEDPDKTDPIYDGGVVNVSEIVTNEHGSHIQVGGQDFLYIGTQIRVDAFMNCDKLSYEQIGLLFEQAARLGVTCVQIPVEWAKLEPQEDVFDYTYLFYMMQFANRYDLKMELLWFGTNMCGDTHSYTVPDYILRDGKTYPKFDALRTGEYWNYYGVMWFLDFDNENLIRRESNALAKMMDYIYEYDSTHGAKQPVIGIQVLNEPDIFARWRVPDKQVISPVTGERMSAQEAYTKICNSLEALGKTVKQSKYRVFTRVNLASSTNSDALGSPGGIWAGGEVKDAPEFAQMIQALESIDFVGDDSYTASVKNIKGIASMYATKLPGNFGQIAENDGSYSNTASLILTAVSQHGGYSIYDLLTSPFFVANGEAKVDQGILLFEEGSYERYVQKDHWQQTHDIIAGLKAVGHEVYQVSPQDFACFNLETDNARQSTQQTITTTHTRLTFATESGAIGFAIDRGTWMDVYVTADATLTVSDATVTAVEVGTYAADGTFTASETLPTDASVSLSGGKLYRISYKDAGTLTSDTWDAIGG